MSKQTLAEAITYAEGVLDRTALSIGVKTDAESERGFRHCIEMAMGCIRHAAASDPRAALEALQKLDFDLRAANGTGLPPEACKIIDGALA